MFFDNLNTLLTRITLWLPNILIKSKLILYSVKCAIWKWHKHLLIFTI